MATPEDKLGSIGGLFDPPQPPAPRKATRAPKPPAPETPGDISHLFDPPASPESRAPARHAPVAPGAAAPAAASPAPPAAPAHPHGAFDSATEGRWSIKHADGLRGWYRQTYGRDLPVTAAGQSGTHNRMGLDHSDSLDVGINPTSEEGTRLREYLRANSIPFLAYDRAVPGASTNAHIHVGFPSRKGSAGDAARLGTISDLFDTAGGQGLDAIAHLFEADPERQKLEEEIGGPIETVNALAAARPAAPAPLPQRQTFDPTTEQGRRGRDEHAALERTPGAFLEVAAPLPAEDKLSDVAAGAEMVRAAYVRALVERGVPEPEAQKLVGTDYVLKSPKGEMIAPADIISDETTDYGARTMRVKIDAAHVSKLADAYKASGTNIGRAYAWATDPERSGGEKLLEAGGAAAAPVVKGAGYVARPFSAASAGVWSAARGQNPLREAYNTFTTGETSAAGSNPIGDYLRDSAVLNRINPRLGRLLGGGADLVLDPVNLVGLGFIGKGAKAIAGAGRLGRAAEELNAVGKALGLLERGIVDARPLGLEAGAGRRVAAAADEFGVESAFKKWSETTGRPADFDVELLTEDGGRLAHSSKTGETVDLRTGEPAELANEVSPAVRGEQLNYARERAAHYAREAETARSSGARQVARELADDYAAEVTRLEAPPAAPGPEGFDLSDIAEAPHHSHAQPRTPAGQFEGPPQSLPRKAWGLLGDTADAMKSNLYSADVSAPYRQALFPLLFETRATARGLAEGLPSFLSRHHAKFTAHVRGLPVAQEANEMGLALSSFNPAAKSEYFPSQAASKLPWVGVSERVMEAQLDAVRLHVYERLTNPLRADGLTPATAREEFEGVARMVNIASGQGELGALSKPLAPALNKVLGSPKLLKSRFQVLSPRTYARLPPRARRIALRKAGRVAAGFTGLFGLAALTADEVGIDPRKPNFGTARFGTTSYDLTGGEASKIRFIVNLVQSVHETAKVARAGGSIKYEDTPVGVATRFLRSQLSPAASIIPDAVTGKDYGGRDFTWTEGTIRRAVPLVIQDVFDGYTSEGGKGALKSLPAFLGVGVRQLDPEKVRRDADRAVNRTAAVELSDVASKELDRLRIDRKRLCVDKVSPGFKVEGTDGESVTPMSKSDPSGVATVAPDDMARDLAEEISGAVEEAVNSPDYQTFESDRARSKYLTQVVRNARARIYAGLRLKARQDQLEDLGRIEGYQRRLEERGRQMRRGPQTLNLDGVRESTNVEDKRPPGQRFKL